MEISIPTTSTLVRNSDGSLKSTVPDETPVYINASTTVTPVFKKDEKLLDGFDKYIVPEKWSPIVYDAGRTYSVDEVVFKDSYIKKVISVGSKDIPAQPADYTFPSPLDTVNTSFLFSRWDCYWARIKIDVNTSETFNGFEKIVGETTHKLYRDNSSSTGWKYQYTYEAEETYWEEERHDGLLTNRTYFAWDSDREFVYAFYDNDTILPILPITTSTMPIPFSSIYTGRDGNRYMVGSVVVPNIRWKIRKERTRIVTVIKRSDNDVYVYASIDDNSIVNHSYNDAFDPDNKWTGRTFVVDGSDLYVRTGDGIDEPEVVSVSTPQFAKVDRLEDFPIGYFSKIGVINALTPFDDTTYSNFRVHGDSTMYVVAPDGKFDTIGMAGLIASSVTITFMDSDYNVVYITSKNINNTRDVAGRLPSAPITEIFYCLDDNDEVLDMPSGSLIKIELFGTLTQCGTIKVGLSANAGFTNLIFTNKFNDRSPKSIDSFGNVSYIEGVKSLVYYATVDVPIENYDMISRLMVSIGGSTIILNGSDSKDNSATDSSSNT